MTCAGNAKKYHLCNAKVSSQFPSFLSSLTHIHSAFGLSNRNASQMPDLTASLTFHFHPRLTVNSCIIRYFFDSFNVCCNQIDFKPSQLHSIDCLSVNYRNVLLQEGASEKNSAGHSTLRFTMEKITTGNLFILVLTVLFNEAVLWRYHLH